MTEQGRRRCALFALAVCSRRRRGGGRKRCCRFVAARADNAKVAHGDSRRCSGVVMMVALRRRWRRKLGCGGVGGDASLQNRGGRKRRWLPWRLMVAARVWGKLGFLFWEMKMMTWPNLIG
ncbi:hypothetical protein DEO72_LG7g1322 [Vigna unguiculata]|uniref:Uncharacterized protein n=1 Tax=Vigna unguiculata TaxID=3917 RepID=A0A4D6MF96_VIGUN|nr:hypothetical protein DEO72_LG7g1322 [Vigna unguiculata]